MKYKTRNTRTVIAPEGEPVFSERATSISIEDAAAGEHLAVAQCRDDNAPGIQIDADEWPALKAAIDKMFKEIEGNEKGSK